jgi:hypothetical protein
MLKVTSNTGASVRRGDRSQFRNRHTQTDSSQQIPVMLPIVVGIDPFISEFDRFKNTTLPASLHSMAPLNAPQSDELFTVAREHDDFFLKQPTFKENDCQPTPTTRKNTPVHTQQQSKPYRNQSV